MSRTLSLLLRNSICVLLICFGAQLQADAPADRSVAALELAQQIIERQREIIVLTQQLESVPEATREQSRLLGRQLFHEQLELRDALLQRWSQELNAASSETATAPEAVTTVLDRLEAPTPWRDADKLALREALEELAAALRGGTSEALPATRWRGELRRRLQVNQAALASVQAHYEAEMRAVLASLGQRGVALSRESWSAYLAFLAEQGYGRTSLLRKHAQRLSPATATDSLAAEGGTRAGSEAAATTAELEPALETFGRQLPDRTLLLTFDDGPHPRYTDQVLDILGRYGLSAVFFAIGKHVGTVDAEGQPVFAARAEVSRRVLEAGSVLGNHSYTHANLPKLDAQALDREIVSTQTLLKGLSADTPPLFRPPYGARNRTVLQHLSAQQLQSMQWNIDSMDWADPVATSVADRVIAEVEKQGRGIILFHDIHTRAVDALPTVLDTLIARGYRFARWDGEGISVDDGTPAQSGARPARVPVPAGATDQVKAPYRDSWAVLIGIDDYAHWPRLNYAVNDAKGVESLLKDKFGFREDRIFRLHDRAASRGNIQSLLGDYLGDPRRVQREDRVFVFFAGHGATRPLASGRDLGYLIPADGKPDELHGTAISMSTLQDIGEAIPAKHLLYVMDSCYSGLALTRSGALGAGSSQNYLSEIARRSARQIYTAGGADQVVADSGPGGHSVFTWALLRALGGEGDLNADGVITATELATWTSPLVSSMSRQTPAFGNLPGSEGGEFFFTLTAPSAGGPPLTQLSAKLDSEAGELDAELTRLREEIARKSQRNSALAVQLAQAQRSLDQLEAAPDGATRNADQTEAAIQHNEAGMAHYQSRDYAAALGEFLTAARLDPAYALATNNVGFVYAKLGQFQQASDWYERTLRIDPQRAVAWLNAADAYVELGRTAEARAAYLQFLELKPDSKAADYARSRMLALVQGTEGAQSPLP